MAAGLARRTVMKTILAAMASAFVLVGAPTVAGTWSMSVDSPHGNVKTSLTLNQDGTKVTGTFISQMPDMPVSGTFDNGRLKLETTGDASSKFLFDARLNEDGTLAGYISSEMGDMKWTAKRVQ
jgi:hypothetical protein